MGQVLSVIIAAALVGVVAGCGSARRTEPIAPPVPLATADLVAGQRVFMAKCQQCHPQGEAGVGLALNNVPAPPFLVRFQIRNGLGAMPSFSRQELGEQEMDQLVGYLLAMRRNI